MATKSKKNEAPDFAPMDMVREESERYAPKPPLRWVALQINGVWAAYDSKDGARMSFPRRRRIDTLADISSLKAGLCQIEGRSPRR